MSGRGLPSWYKYRAYGPVYEEIRLAEHAVRLGSIDSFDRRGDVIWFDDFESGLNKWIAITSGANGKISPSVDWCRSKGLSAKLNTGTGSDSYALILAELATSTLGKHGIETHLSEIENLGEFYLELHYYTGTQEKYGRARWLLSGQTLQVRDRDAGWVTIATGVTVVGSYRSFMPLKLVVDFENNKYMRLMVKNSAYDISDKNLLLTTVGSLAGVRAQIIVYNKDTSACVAHIDDVIITQNEP